eukprot:TRINITY_DN8500_c0_g1_i1.p1 TRINITY_DN8500_c0_g1~~TRINITY_DN8500_c0_g1_i1.p1  ORF type:complete len:1141 (-),score=425.00 TRINITY_DN8500_c0_g1_i1:16-3438(-)
MSIFHTSAASLSKILTEECIRHFMQASKVPPPNLSEESRHPYDNHLDYRKCLHIQGASKLIIKFDPRCNVHNSDPLTRCAFYADEEYNEIIASYRGGQFAPLTVDSDRVYFRFTSGAGETFWGYKFSVTPVNLRLNNIQALNGLNFQLGYWLLELLLDKGPQRVRTTYLGQLYDSLVYYVQASKRSAKAKGYSLLLRILQEIQFSPEPIQVNLENILKLQKQLEKRYERELNEEGETFSVHLQSLVELVATAVMARNAMEDKPHSRFYLEKETPLTDIVKRRLKIISARFGDCNDRNFSENFTDEFQQLVELNGGSHLVIPGDYSQIPFLVNSLGEDKELEIQYEIQDESGKILSQRTERNISGTEFEIGTGIWFRDVLDVIDNTQRFNLNRTFSDEFVALRYATWRLQNEYYWTLLTDSTTQSDVPAVSLPIQCYRFSISFWIFLRDGPVKGRRTIYYKGVESYGSVNSVTIESDSANFSFTVGMTMPDGSVVDQVVTSESQIPMGILSHWAFVVNVDTIKIYFNGKQDGIFNQVGSRPKFNNYPMFILKTPMGIQSSENLVGDLGGDLKDVRWYSRTISEREVNDMYMAMTDSVTVPKVPTMTQIQLEELQNKSSKWNLIMDEQLLEYANILAEKDNLSTFGLDSAILNPSSEFLNQFPALLGIPTDVLQFRFECLRTFNLKYLCHVLSLIDFSQAQLPWSLAHQITKLKDIIFMRTKAGLWNRILAQTNTGSGRGGTRIQINRPRALRAKEKGDLDGSRSVFGQAFRQLHFCPPAALRRRGQVWNVTYSGEGGTDAGGLFRDSVSHICSDLQSPYVPLFIPCPNSGGFGDNAEKFIPRSGATSSLHLSMFSFVGKLMGIAIRAKHILNLDFPSVVWKGIVGTEVTRSDVESIDAFSFKMMDQIVTAERQPDMTPDMFNELIDMTFTVQSSDGREIELVENGKTQKVTWENRRQYLSLAEKWKISEFSEQIQAMKSGLGTIVPIQLLAMFSWRELELSVCGKREVNLELLKRNTKYANGYRKTDAAIAMFWRVFNEFSTKDRELFLRFVWGRSRLPNSHEDFDEKFVIMPTHVNNDNILPISHTCFFQLELPAYSSDEVMKTKILYAINECREIDADHQAQNVDWDADAEEAPQEDDE